MALFEIAAFAILYSLISFGIMTLTGTRKKMKEVRDRMNELQKESNDLVKKGEEKKAMEAQEQMLKLSTSSMSLQFKPLLLIIPIFFVFIGTGGLLGIQFHGVIPAMYPSFTIELPFAIHMHEILAGFTWNPLTWLGIFGNILHSSVYGPKGFFIVVVIFMGMFIELVATKILEKTKQIASVKKA